MSRPRPGDSIPDLGPALAPDALPRVPADAALDAIPDVVLDELRSAFSGSGSGSGSGAPGAPSGVTALAPRQAPPLPPSPSSPPSPLPSPPGPPLPLADVTTTAAGRPADVIAADASLAAPTSRRARRHARRAERRAARAAKRQRRRDGATAAARGPADEIEQVRIVPLTPAPSDGSGAGTASDTGGSDRTGTPPDRSGGDGTSPTIALVAPAAPVAPAPDASAAPVAAAPDASAAPGKAPAPAVASTSPGPSTSTAADAATTTPPGGRSTIVIGGDDLPDAVYLDDDAEPRLKELYGATSGSSAAVIVLGDELDSTGAFDAVALPSRMDPRVRARRIAVKRAAGRKRLLWLAGVVLVLLVAVGVIAVVASPLFDVEADDIEVTGAVYSDPAQLRTVFDTVIGDPVLLVDTAGLEAQLERLPWVERALVSTDFPHGLEIDLRERVPLATFTGSDGRFRVIDREGRVLAVLDNQPVDYMLLTGGGPDTDAGQFAGRPFAHAAQLVSVLPAEIRRITASVSVDASTGDLGLLVQPDVPVRLGGFQDIETKLARILQYLRSDGGLAECARVDVSTGEVSCAT